MRVRLYAGSTLAQTYTLNAPAGSVPTSVDESSLTRAWNVLVPGTLIQPGLKLLADVDPAGAVAESNEGNNMFPASGTPGAVDVRALPTFAFRFVPVRQQVNGLQGDVTLSNKESYLPDLKAMLPIGAYDADIRAVYTTTAPALDASNSNGAWSTVINEVLALRGTDASNRYYYGLVKVSYGSGIAGLGYVGGTAHTAVGWDWSSTAPNVLAHELGHNLGLQHAPCGGAGSPDPSYPYSGGAIGVWGLDPNTLALQYPSLGDVMSYCHPNWISDYNWSMMVGYRQSSPQNLRAEGALGASGLLVWGRVTAAGVVLEPAFKVALGSDLLPRAGSNRLELLGTDGAVLRSVSFATEELADLPGGPDAGGAPGSRRDARREPERRGSPRGGRSGSGADPAERRAGSGAVGREPLSDGDGARRGDRAGALVRPRRIGAAVDSQWKLRADLFRRRSLAGAAGPGPPVARQRRRGMALLSFEPCPHPLRSWSPARPPASVRRARWAWPAPDTGSSPRCAGRRTAGGSRASIRRSSARSCWT